MVRRSEDAVDARLSDIDSTLRQLTTGLQALTIQENNHAENAETARNQLSDKTGEFRVSFVIFLDFLIIIFFLG